MDCDEAMVNTVYFAMAELNGQWKAIFTAANEEDAQIGDGRFVSEWMNSYEEAEAKMIEVCKFLASIGLKVLPMKPPS